MWQQQTPTKEQMKRALSHLKNATYSEKSPAKFYIFETQIAAAMLSLTVEARHNAAAFILGP